MTKALPVGFVRYSIRPFLTCKECGDLGHDMDMTAAKRRATWHVRSRPDHLVYIDKVERTEIYVAEPAGAAS